LLTATYPEIDGTPLYTQATAAMSGGLTREHIEKSLGLVIFLAALYATFFFGLMLNRYRRTKESLEYLK
jgi:hypothetical protein